MEDKKEKTISDILKLVAPGTPIREGIDNVLRAKTGGLIVMGYNEKVKELVDGGFHIDCAFTPSNLYELAKMDGAIILNETGTKVILANAHLAPDSSIPSSETGMRHRTAERVARQTNSLVIAISQRRNVITLYQGKFRYALKDIGVILTKANQAIQTLEKYKMVLDQAIANLTMLEFEELVTYSDVLQVLHKIEMVLRIKKELLAYLSELGVEGRLIQLQMNELLSDMEDEAMLIIRDYSKDRQVKPFEVLFKFQELVTNELLDDSVLLKLLGFSGHVPIEEGIYPRGYRALSKIPRLPIVIIENLITKFHWLPEIVKADVDKLDDVEGIGEVRARKIKEGLRLIKDQMLADRQL
ncbi:MAG: DNA integrity scanning protein DisA [Bacillales bacterium]|nr:DNA integrity scanning protein DisA [Bacillales bacterium]